EVGIPHRLIEQMAIAHLRRHGADDLLPRGIVVALRIAGIDEIAVAFDAPPVAPERSGQQAGAAQGLGDESFHDTLLSRSQKSEVRSQRSVSGQRSDL